MSEDPFGPLEARLESPSVGRWAKGRLPLLLVGGLLLTWWLLPLLLLLRPEGSLKWTPLGWLFSFEIIARVGVWSFLAHWLRLLVTVGLGAALLIRSQKARGWCLLALGVLALAARFTPEYWRELDRRADHLLSLPSAWSWLVPAFQMLTVLCLAAVGVQRRGVRPRIANIALAVSGGLLLAILILPILLHRDGRILLIAPLVDFSSAGHQGVVSWMRTVFTGAVIAMGLLSIALASARNAPLSLNLSRALLVVAIFAVGFEIATYSFAGWLLHGGGPVVRGNMAFWLARVTMSGICLLLVLPLALWDLLPLYLPATAARRPLPAAPCRPRWALARGVTLAAGFLLIAPVIMPYEAESLISMGPRQVERSEVLEVASRVYPSEVLTPIAQVTGGVLIIACVFLAGRRIRWIVSACALGAVAALTAFPVSDRTPLGMLQELVPPGFGEGSPWFSTAAILVGGLVLIGGFSLAWALGTRRVIALSGILSGVVLLISGSFMPLIYFGPEAVPVADALLRLGDSGMPWTQPLLEWATALAVIAAVTATASAVGLPRARIIALVGAALAAASLAAWGAFLMAFHVWAEIRHAEYLCRFFSTGMRVPPTPGVILTRSIIWGLDWAGRLMLLAFVIGEAFAIWMPRTPRPERPGHETAAEPAPVLQPATAEA